MSLIKRQTIEAPTHLSRLLPTMTSPLKQTGSEQALYHPDYDLPGGDLFFLVRISPILRRRADAYHCFTGGEQVV